MPRRKAITKNNTQRKAVQAPKGATISLSRYRRSMSGGRRAVADVTPPEKRAMGMGLIGAAFGLAVVASAVGAFVEDVPRVGGILVPPNNPQTLAQVLAIAKPKERSYHNPDLTFQLLARQFVAWLEGGLRR